MIDSSKLRQRVWAPQLLRCAGMTVMRSALTACCVALLVVSVTVSVYSQAGTPPSTVPASKPHIVVLGTGGTIASSRVGGAEAPALSVQQLIDAVPPLKEIAVFTSEDVVNIESEDRTNAVWLKLANRLNDVLTLPDVNGVVITHGTDTLEETAYFLHLQSEFSVQNVTELPAVEIISSSPELEAATSREWRNRAWLKL